MGQCNDANAALLKQVSKCDMIHIPSNVNNLACTTASLTILWNHNDTRVICGKMFKTKVLDNSLQHIPKAWFSHDGSTNSASNHSRLQVAFNQ